MAEVVAPIELGELRGPGSSATATPAVFRAIHQASAFRLRPRPDRHGELAISDAVRQRRRRGVERLRESFGGFRFDRVMQNTDANAASVLSVDPGFLHRLDGPGIVDRTLASHHLPTPHLSFARGGDQGHLPAPDGVLLSGEAMRFERVRTPALVQSVVDDGYSAIINGIDQLGDPELADLCEDFEVASGTRVQINTYISQQVAEGFGAHWDDHDVVILQLLGRKYWEIHEPSALSPLNDYIPPTVSGRVVWSGVLEPGVALFIPRGWGHRVSGFDELSIHFTIGMRRMNGLDVLERMANLATNDDWLREDVPLDPADWRPPDAPPVDGPGEGPPAGPGVAAHLLAGRSMYDAAEASAAFWCAQILPRRYGNFSSSFNALTGDLRRVRLVSGLSGGVSFADLPDDPPDADTSWKVAAGLMVRNDPRLDPLLAALLPGEPLAVADLPDGGLGAEAVAQLVGVLLRAGWVRVAEGGAA